MQVAAYTTDPTRKRRFCRRIRKLSDSWNQIKSIMYINDAALAFFVLLVFYAAANKPERILLAVFLSLFLAVLSALFHRMANTDVKEMFKKRKEETLVILENGDLLYSYRVKGKCLSTVVLKMKKNDTETISRTERPNINIAIFTGAISRTVTTLDTLNSLSAVAMQDDAANMKGSIICPEYIIPNSSMSRLLGDRLPG